MKYLKIPCSHFKRILHKTAIITAQNYRLQNLLKQTLWWRSWEHFVKLLSNCTFSLHLLKSIESCRFSQLENTYQISCPILQRTHYPIFSIINIIFNVLNQAAVHVSPGFTYKMTEANKVYLHFLFVLKLFLSPNCLNILHFSLVLFLKMFLHSLNSKFLKRLRRWFNLLMFFFNNFLDHKHFKGLMNRRMQISSKVVNFFTSFNAKITLQKTSKFRTFSIYDWQFSNFLYLFRFSGYGSCISLSMKKDWFCW